MVLPSLLIREKIVKLSELGHNPKILKGFVRVVSDSKNKIKTQGFFMDEEAFGDLLESMEYSSPNFWSELEKSRKSGRVSSKEIERRLGL